MSECECVHEGRSVCHHVTEGVRSRVQVNEESVLTYCVAKQWLLEHMPEFDKSFLPPSVSVHGASMFDDNIVFALMADQANHFASTLSYILPYATFHEARTNWRPLLFAKFFALVENATSTHEAMAILASPPWSSSQAPAFTAWTEHQWPSYPLKTPTKDTYSVRWSSSTSPPVTGVFDFAAYGYGSCTAWSTLLTYVARAVGIPARQVGTPCWNTGEFAGLATNNPNVSSCWQGGKGNDVGGKYLNNHNWVEYWSSEESKWVFINDPPQTTDENQGLCGNFSDVTGCDYNALTGCSDAKSGPALASRDHEIFSVTWSLSGEEGSFPQQGGDVIDVRNLRLSSGEEVSPLVWSPRLVSPLGEPLRNVGLRVVNRTDFYRCKQPGGH